MDLTRKPSRENELHAEWMSAETQQDFYEWAFHKLLAASPQAGAQREGGQALTFTEFSRVNRQRCEAKDGFNHQLNSWSTSDWVTAFIGEFGETANIVKKLNRIRDGIPGNKLSEEELRTRLRQELGDTFVYLDLLAQSVNVSICEAAVEVFNAKSQELGCSIVLTSPPSREPGRVTPEMVFSLSEIGGHCSNPLQRAQMQAKALNEMLSRATPAPSESNESARELSIAEELRLILDTPVNSWVVEGRCIVHTGEENSGPLIRDHAAHPRTLALIADALNFSVKRLALIKLSRRALAERGKRERRRLQRQRLGSNAD